MPEPGMILVGSKNPTKINAVREAFALSEKFHDCEIISVDVQVEEFGHPKSLHDTIWAAVTRAKQVWDRSCWYSVGIEGGLMEVPYTKTGYMQVEVCAIYNGEMEVLGLSPAFEWPMKAFHMIQEGLDGSQACKAAGLTSEEKIGTHGGVISILTRGQINRTDYNVLAVQMALVQLDNPSLY